MLLCPNNNLVLSCPHLVFENLIFNIVVNATTANSSVSSPGVDVGTGLASPHVSYSRFMPEITHFRIITSLWPVLKNHILHTFAHAKLLTHRKVTLERLERP
jgi:hypothetical protein